MMIGGPPLPVDVLLPETLCPLGDGAPPSVADFAQLLEGTLNEPVAASIAKPVEDEAAVLQEGDEAAPEALLALLHIVAPPPAQPIKSAVKVGGKDTDGPAKVSDDRLYSAQQSAVLTTAPLPLIVPIVASAGVAPSLPLVTQGSEPHAMPQPVEQAKIVVAPNGITEPIGNASPPLLTNAAAPLRNTSERTSPTLESIALTLPAVISPDVQVSAPAASPAPPVEAQQLARQFAVALPRLSQQGVKTELTLDPAKLGRVTLSWESSTGAFAALRIVATDPATAQLLSGYRDHLTALLHQDAGAPKDRPAEFRIEVAAEARPTERRASPDIQPQPSGAAPQQHGQHSAPQHSPAQTGARFAVNNAEPAEDPAADPVSGDLRLA
jgi:hypothetical protein